MLCNQLGRSPVGMQMVERGGGLRVGAVFCCMEREKQPVFCMQYIAYEHKASERAEDSAVSLTGACMCGYQRLSAALNGHRRLPAATQLYHCLSRSAARD